jgi:hypothetical protein
MPTPILPTEVWAIIFEKLDLPISTRVVRHNYDELIRQVFRLYDAGHWNVATILPEFERVRWAEMRRYHNINHSLREAAERARLSEKWTSSLERPVLYLHPPVAIKKCPQYASAYDPRQIFHGTRTPEDIAVNPYSSLFMHRFRSPSGSMAFAKNFFLEFATNNPVFSTLRRIDLIMLVSQDSHENARHDMDTLVRCADAEWNAHQSSGRKSANLLGANAARVSVGAWVRLSSDELSAEISSPWRPFEDESLELSQYFPSRL